MSVRALGVDKIVNYPRPIVEPLLWLTVTSGAVWLLVGLDARGKTGTKVAPIDSRIALLATMLALVLLLNGIAALLFSAQGGTIARGLATISGVGLVVAGWGWTRIPEIDRLVRTQLVWGFVVAGIALAILSAVKWHTILPPDGPPQRGWMVMVAMGVLGVVALVAAFRGYQSLDKGLVGVASSKEPAWDTLIPSWMLLTAMLAALGQAWNQRWWSTLGTAAIGVLLAAGVVPSVF